MRSPLSYHIPVTISLLLSISSALAQPFQYKPIIYLPGDNLDYPFHAWFEFEHPLVEEHAFLNVRLTNIDTEQTAWLIENLPLLPDQDPRQIRYRMDVQEISSPSGMPESVRAEISIGPYALDGTFPAPVIALLPASPENHFVPSGMPRLVHNYIPFFPPIPPLPPILPDTVIGMNRGCDVPNIDLDSLGHPDPVTGDINSCAPAAAANSLKWLMDVHPEIPDVDSLRGILDTLEALSGKTAKGTPWDSLIMGKLAFIDKHQLPIRVKYQVHTPKPDFKPIIPSPEPKYGHAAENETGASGFPDIDWIMNELDEGEDVEMIITYWCDSMGVRVQRTTHAINVIGYVKVGEMPWLVWKHDVDQVGPGGTIEEYGRWCVDTAGYPFLKEMSETDGCIAYVGSVISESYDPNVLFTDVSKYDWSYRPVIYLSGGIQDYPFHAWLTWTIPAGGTATVLNARICNPATGEDAWILRNIPIPDVSSDLPVRLKLDLGPLVTGDTMPSRLIIKYHLGDVQTDATFPVHAYAELMAQPSLHVIPSGTSIGPHPLIPVIPPIHVPPIPGALIDALLRGCEVPNIDLDSMMYPLDSMDISATDWNACGPAAAANSMQWLDDQHDEIDIPIEIRPMLDSLKKMMKHNMVTEGVYWEDMVKGKLEFIDRYHLPIRVKYQAHANAPAEIPSPNPLYGHKATNESPPNPDAPPPYLHPTFEWLCQELEEDEDVELLYGYYCDTIIFVEVIDTIVFDTLDDGTIVPDTSYTIEAQERKKRESGHAVNVTGKITIGPLKWITYKHDVYQDGPGGTSPDDVPPGYEYTDLSEWVMDEKGYSILTRENYVQQDGDVCTAYVEAMFSESYDPDIDFCPEKVCFPDDDGEGTLRRALICIEDGGTITLGADVGGDTIRLTSEPLIINKNVMIKAEPDLAIYIKGESVERVFEISAGMNVVFEGLNIICGEGSAAACVMNAGNVVFRDCRFYNHDGMPGTASQIINTGTMEIEGTTNLRID